MGDSTSQIPWPRWPLRTRSGISLRDAVVSLEILRKYPAGSKPFRARRQFQVFVDYAHTPDALLNVIKTLRELGPRRLIVVLAAAAIATGRKRPLMAEVVDQNADHAIITSDNPRKEDPESIIAEVEKGFRSKHYEKVVDRAAAIATGD